MKQSISLAFQKTEKFFGNLKFAVVIISIFAIYLTIGTFMESYHGTDYANRLIYKSLPFMLVQTCMFFSILFATTLRLPLKKRLYGFYTLHLGLLTLFIGSFITYVAGIDGNMTLYPNTPERNILLNQDEFKMQILERKKEYTLELPYIPWSKNINQNFEDLKLLEFLPFADEKIQWLKTSENSPERLHSSSYTLFNDNFQEELTLSLHLDSDFKTSTQMGPLNVHYMPFKLMKCFKEMKPHGLIMWDADIGECFVPTPQLISPVKSAKGMYVFSYPIKNQKYIFIPDMSPMPMNKEQKMIENSPYRIFSTKLFEDKPHLFLFGTGASFFDKDLKNWQTYDLKVSGTAVELPWMGFKILLNVHQSNAYPKLIPEETTPVQDNGKIIKGNTKAIQLSINNETFWLKNSEPIKFNLKNEEWTLSLGGKTLQLPFEIILNNFKMDTDPGTKNPASYESFVTLFKGNEGSSKHHVFMNNPLKEGNFTFYQASYFEVQPGVLGSVLSVNYDPGRFWKYLGSFLLVFGSIWHFAFRSLKDKKHV